VNPTEPVTTPIGNPGPNPTEPTVDYSGLKAPEGYTLDNDTLVQFRNILGKTAVSAATAQELLNWQAGQIAVAAKAIEAKEVEEAKQAEAELRADTEFGGAKYDESVGKVRRVLEDFWDKDTAGLIINSNLANNAKFVRGLINVAKATAEAPLVPGTGAAPKDALRTMYPTMPDEYFDSKAA
jgi:hypothetical protein